MEVVHYPDPVLRRGGKPIERFDPELTATAEQMLATMYAAGGVGLAAPQVGLELDLLVLNPSGDATDRKDEMVLVNPRILARKRLEYGQEGCLSFPGVYAEVERAKQIVLAYQDLSGKTLEVRSSEFIARIIQHEFDHLQGVLFVDRLSPTDRIRLRTSLERMEERFRARA